MLVSSFILFFGLLCPLINAQITVVQFGDNVPPLIISRVLSYIQKSSQYPVQLYAANATIPALSINSLILSFGDTVTTRELISFDEFFFLKKEKEKINSLTPLSKLIINLFLFIYYYY